MRDARRVLVRRSGGCRCCCRAAQPSPRGAGVERDRHSNAFIEKNNQLTRCYDMREFMTCIIEMSFRCTCIFSALSFFGQLSDSFMLLFIASSPANQPAILTRSLSFKNLQNAHATSPDLDVAIMHRLASLAPVEEQLVELAKATAV